jgi:hypothetical protein
MNAPTVHLSSMLSYFGIHIWVCTATISAPVLSHSKDRNMIQYFRLGPTRLDLGTPSVVKMEMIERSGPKSSTCTLMWGVNQVFGILWADLHIPCRSHAVPMPFPCCSPAVLKTDSHIPCRSPAITLPLPCHSHWPVKSEIGMLLITTSWNWVW